MTEPICIHVSNLDTGSSPAESPLLDSEPLKQEK